MYWILEISQASYKYTAYDLKYQKFSTVLWIFISLQLLSHAISHYSLAIHLKYIIIHLPSYYYHITKCPERVCGLWGECQF